MVTVQRFWLEDAKHRQVLSHKAFDVIFVASLEVLEVSVDGVDCFFQVVLRVLLDHFLVPILSLEYPVSLIQLRMQLILNVFNVP